MKTNESTRQGFKPQQAEAIQQRQNPKDNGGVSEKISGHSPYSKENTYLCFVVSTGEKYETGTILNQ